MKVGIILVLVKSKINKILLWIVVTLAFLACRKNDISRNVSQLPFSSPQPVNVSGYSNQIMEPFLSRDGSVLFFNNWNHPSVVTNLHYANRVDDLNFIYQGELSGANTEDLEGVATLDASGKLYFVSTRNYDENFSTIYRGDFANGTVSNVELVSGISLEQAGWINFDVEVSEDGEFLFTVDGLYDQNGGPYESNLVVAAKLGNGFERLVSQSIVQNVNSVELEYAACISSDMLELYFTRVDAPLTAESIPQIYVGTRSSTSEPFREPYRIEEITGFVEGPTISPDGQIIYYHKKVNGLFKLYMVRKE